MFNSCVNVIIYATFGKQFRKKFFELFCSPCQKYDSEISSEIPLKTNATAKTDLSTSRPASEANSVVIFFFPKSGLTDNLWVCAREQHSDHL